MKKFSITLALVAILAGLFTLPLFPPSEHPRSVARETGIFQWTHLDASGNVLDQWTTTNGLADEGEQLFLNCTLIATGCPTTFYLRLFNDTPAETDTLADLTGEPSGNGYAAIEVTRDATGWPTLALDTGDYQATSKTVTFSASGGSWGPVTYAVLATTSNNTGKLVSYTALSTSRTLANGESLQVTYKLKLQ
jgi:hypothetical protein